MTHALAKLIKTMRICATLFMARTFGEYEHSGWNGDHDYVQYNWRGKSWRIPTSEVEPL